MSKEVEKRRDEIQNIILESLMFILERSVAPSIKTDYGYDVNSNLLFRIRELLKGEECFSHKVIEGRYYYTMGKL